jgi:hypothetical protein
MIYLLAPITPALLMYAFSFFFIIPFLMYEFKNPRSIMYEEKKKHQFFARLENTGRLKIKQYYLFDFFLVIILLDENLTKKYFYFHGLKKNKYIKFYKTKKEHAQISSEEKRA